MLSTGTSFKDVNEIRKHLAGVSVHANNNKMKYTTVQKKKKERNEKTSTGRKYRKESRFSPRS